jgi:cyclohexa-1,5-dienecarbonyl-CoA hydratase
MQVLAQLRDALAHHSTDRSLRLVVLRGAGGTFSYGASVEEHRRDVAPKMLRGFHALVREVAGYAVPIAAVVEGRCLGGAFELVLACHFVFATETAVFGCPEIKLGVIPPVLAAIGRHRLGPLAERLLLTGRELGAREASAYGAIEALVQTGSDPRAFVLEWYRANLAPLSALALREATRAGREASGLVASLGAPLDALERGYIERLLPSHDANEGIEAFLAKRAPRWEDA